MDSRERGGAALGKPSLREYEEAFQRIANELEKLGFETGTYFSADRRRTLTLLDGLTRREQQIVDRFLEGHSTAEIAALSHISVHTVKNHLKSIRRKLGAHSQVELLRMLNPLPRPF